MPQSYPAKISYFTGDEKSINEIANEVLRVIEHGTTSKEICGIPDHIMDGIYAHAYEFYQKGCIDEAKIFFEFLVAHDIYNSDYIMGLAAVHQRKKNYAKAAQLYELAFVLNSNNIQSRFYAGQCWLFLKNSQKANECFSFVAENKVPDTLKRQALAYLAAIQPAKDEGKIHA